MNERSEIVIKDELVNSRLFIWIIEPTMIKRWINGRFKKMITKFMNWQCYSLQITK